MQIAAAVVDGDSLESSGFLAGTPEAQLHSFADPISAMGKIKIHCTLYPVCLKRERTVLGPDIPVIVTITWTYKFLHVQPGYHPEKVFGGKG